MFALIGACGTPADESPAIDAAADASDADAAAPDGPVADAPLPDVDAGAQIPAGELGNNGAILAGPDVVTGNPVRRKALVAQLEQTSLPIVMGRAYALAAGTSTVVWYLVEATNTGPTDYCFVDFDLALRDGQGEELGREPAHAYVDGSVRRLSSVTTGTCLGPGERAWATASSNDIEFDRVARVRIDVDGRPSAPNVPAAQVMPVRYEVVEGRVSVELVNRGTQTATLRFMTWISLDEVAQPGSRGYLGAPTTTLAPGARVVAVATTMAAGTVRGVEVRIDYEDSPMSAR